MRPQDQLKFSSGKLKLYEIRFDHSVRTAFHLFFQKNVEKRKYFSFVLRDFFTDRKDSPYSVDFNRAKLLFFQDKLNLSHEHEILRVYRNNEQQNDSTISFCSIMKEEEIYDIFTSEKSKNNEMFRKTIDDCNSKYKTLSVKNFAAENRKKTSVAIFSPISGRTFSTTRTRSEHFARFTTKLLDEKRSAQLCRSTRSSRSANR